MLSSTDSWGRQSVQQRFAHFDLWLLLLSALAEAVSYCFKAVLAFPDQHPALPSLPVAQHHLPASVISGRDRIDLMSARYL